MFFVFPAVMNTSEIMTGLVWLHGLWPVLPLPLPVLDRNSKCEDAFPSASATAAAQCSRQQGMLFMALWDLSLLPPSQTSWVSLSTLCWYYFIASLPETSTEDTGEDLW